MIDTTSFENRSVSVGALACVRSDIAQKVQPDFDLSGMRIFTTVPDHADIGIVALKGMVVVYDQRPLCQEGIVEGGFYVRESQRPASCMSWERWLEAEVADRSRRSGPAGPLKIRREVVQAIRWPYPTDWALRLASGHVDGPFYDWAIGIDLIGKVAGIYLPTIAAKEC